MNRFYRLLAYGYLPKELPPIFSSRDFASATYAEKNPGVLAGKKWQRASQYLLQQKPHYKRRLDVLCPHAMLKQAHLIADNYTQLSKAFTHVDGNCSCPAFNRKTKFQRAVRPYAIGIGYTKRKLTLRARFPLILKLDVKNYYRSIYTHSIPWAIHGKKYAKAHPKKNILGNLLDRAFQQGQDGQTIGIPTGPDTSFIVSEIVLCQIIDVLVKRRAIRADRFVRYYDDIEYGCETEEEAHRVLTAFEDALRSYELETNPEKVRIVSGPKQLDNPWIVRLLDLKRGKDIKADRLIHVFSAVAEIAEQYPDDRVYRYFLRTMRTSIVHESAWPVFEKILLAIFQDNRGDAKEVYEQFLAYRYLGYRLNKKAIEEAIDRKIAGQLRRGVTSELSWAMYGYMTLGLRPTKDVVLKVFERGDVPSRVLAAKLATDTGFSFRAEVTACVRDWDTDVLNSPEWLLAYEVMIHQWQRKGVRVPLPPDNRALYELLVDQNISFLDDDAVLTAEAPSVFKKAKAKKEPDTVEPDAPEIMDFIAKDEVEKDSADETVEDASDSGSE